MNLWLLVTVSLALEALLLVLVMFAYRAWEIRAGRFSIESILTGKAAERKSKNVYIRTCSQQMVSWGSFVNRHMVRAGKGSAKVAKRVATSTSSILDEVYTNEKVTKDKEASFYLKDIAEHKRANAKKKK